jgi:phosphoserine phosphatase RsbU/P
MWGMVAPSMSTAASPTASPARAESRPRLRVLIVEDSEFDARILNAHLRQGGWAVESQRVADGPAFLATLKSACWDLILCDHSMPGFSAPEALTLLQGTDLDIPFIIVSGGIEEGVAIAAMKSGAHDFLMKGALGRLVPAVQRELREAQVRSARRVAEAALRESELRYRSVWENSTDAVLLIDLSGAVRFASPAVDRLFGWRPEDLVGGGLDRLQSGDTPPGAWWQAATSPGTGVLESEARRRDGSVLEVEIAFTQMTMGEQRWHVAFIRDITERRRQEREISKSREEFAAARDIQERLFPKVAPSFEGFDIAGLSQPAEAAGGDSYDHVTLADGSLALIVADVSGHGVGAALLMAETRTCLRMLARDHSQPSELLNQANRLLAEDLGSENYVTLAFARLTCEPRALDYAGAGHPPMWILGADGAIKARLPKTGLPLGRQRAKPYEQLAPVPLASGDIVLLMTDGIDEAMRADGEFFGVERAFDVIRAHRDRPAAEIGRAICQAARAFTAPQPPTDDFTVLVARVL